MPGFFSKRTSYTIAMTAIAIGVLFLLNNLHIIHLTSILSHIWALVLIIIGAFIIYTHVTGKPILDQIRKSIARKMTSRFDSGGDFKTFGELEIVFRDDTLMSGRYQTGLGELNVDCRQVSQLEGEQQLDLIVGLGDLNLKLPANLPVRIQARNVAGTIRIPGETREGFQQYLIRDFGGFENADSRLLVSCSLFLGDIEIFRD